MTIDHSQIQAGEMQLPCQELDRTLPFFTDVLGFSIVSIFPADAPRTVVLDGFGVRLRLHCGDEGAPGMLRLYCRDPAAIAAGESELIAPNGTRIKLLQAEAPLSLPPLQPALTITRLHGDDAWATGRAGMQYRDLIPDRQGGRFIASHIRIPSGGPVPDYVHFHRVYFQLIYCYKGWVRVVYEDQGPPFVMQAGDCVLQPPQIRHRVLDSSDGLEVVELTCPAEHETLADRDMQLPTSVVDAGRNFSGQRFVRHREDRAEWLVWRGDEFACRDLGLGSGSGGIVSARVVRPAGGAASHTDEHDAELLFVFVLYGKVTLKCDDKPADNLAAGDACVIPAGMVYTLTRCSADLQFLEVIVAARAEASP